MRTLVGKGASALVLLLGASLLRAAPVSAAHVPKCFGKRATYVGTDGPDYIGPDIAHPGSVIVTLGGDDRVVVADGDVRVCTGSGDDIVFPPQEDGYGVLGQGPYRIDLGPGNDLALAMSREAVTILGGPGDDEALARVATSPSSPMPTSLLVGGRGNDHLLSFDNGSFVMKGGPGNDQLDSRSGDSSTLLGGPGADVLDARAGNEGEYFVSPNPDALDGGGPNGRTGDICYMNTNDVARGCEQIQLGL
jgi:Ca2+-binding RTX toxin-like protein